VESPALNADAERVLATSLDVLMCGRIVGATALIGIEWKYLESNGTRIIGVSSRIAVSERRSGGAVSWTCLGFRGDRRFVG
jgi:hypothetical protein